MNANWLSFLQLNTQCALNNRANSFSFFFLSYIFIFHHFFFLPSRLVAFLFLIEQRTCFCFRLQFRFYSFIFPLFFFLIFPFFSISFVALIGFGYWSRLWRQCNGQLYIWWWLQENYRFWNQIEQRWHLYQRQFGFWTQKFIWISNYCNRQRWVSAAIYMAIYEWLLALWSTRAIE